MTSRRCSRKRGQLLGRLTLLLCLVSPAGCASRMTEARQAYSEGRFPQALAHLRHIQQVTRDETDRARYALYRGLTHLALGEPHEAYQWLDQCRTLHALHPELLSESELGSLRSAWHSLGLTPEDTVGFRRGHALE